MASVVPSERECLAGVVKLGEHAYSIGSVMSYGAVASFELAGSEREGKRSERHVSGEEGVVSDLDLGFHGRLVLTYEALREAANVDAPAPREQSVSKEVLHERLLLAQVPHAGGCSLGPGGHAPKGFEHPSFEELAADEVEFVAVRIGVAKLRELEALKRSIDLESSVVELVQGVVVSVAQHFRAHRGDREVSWCWRALLPVGVAGDHGGAVADIFENAFTERVLKGQSGVAVVGARGIAAAVGKFGHGPGQAWLIGG